MGGYEHDMPNIRNVPGLDPRQLRPSKPNFSREFRRIVAPSFDYGVTYYNNSRANLLRGLVNRVLTYKGGPVLQPSPGAWRKLIPLAKKIGMRCRASPMSPSEFLACYVGRKRTIYQKALASLEHTPLNNRDFVVRAFLKKEKDKLLSSSSDPRIIQPRHPRFLVSLGRYIRPLEQKCYKEFTKLFQRFAATPHPVCFKGLNYLRRGEALRSKWASFRRPVAICLDASRFDLHVSVEALQHTHHLYYAAFGMDPLLMQLLENRLETHGVAICKEGSYRYRKRGGRCSGDNDTSLGNVIIMLSITHHLLEGLSVPHVEVINDGDDQVLIVEREHESTLLEAVEPCFAKFGFRLTVEQPVYELEHIDFCQTRPVQLSPDVVTMVRHPRIAMTKDLTSFIPIERGLMKYHMLSAIGACGMACYNDIPVLGAMYRKLAQVGDSAGGKQDRWWASTNASPDFQRLSSKAATNVGLTVEARVSFWKAFGILPDYQVALEEEWQNWKPNFDVCVVSSFVGEYPVVEGDV